MKDVALLCKSCNASESEPCAYPTENAKRLQATVDELCRDLNLLDAQLDEKDVEITKLQDMLQERKVDIHELHSSREYYLNRYRTMRDRLRDANFENTKLQTENESLREALRDSTDKLECHYTDKEVIAQIRHNREELNGLD